MKLIRKGASSGIERTRLSEEQKSPSVLSSIGRAAEENLPLISGIGIPAAAAKVAGRALGPMGIPISAAAGGLGYSGSELIKNVRGLSTLLRGGSMEDIPSEQRPEMDFGKQMLGLGGSMASMAGAEGAAQVGGKLISPLTSFLKRRPAGLYGSAIDLTRGEALKEIGAGKNLAQEAVERGAVGSIDGLLKQAKTVLKSTGKQIDDVVGASKEAMSIRMFDLKTAVSKALKDSISQAKKVGNVAQAKAMERVAKDILKESGETLTEGGAVKLNRILNKQIAQTFGKDVDELTGARVKAQRLISDTIRNEIRKANPALAELLDTQHFWMRMRTVMEAKKATERAGGDIPKGAWGIISLLLKPIRSPEFLTPTAVGLNLAGSAVGKISPTAAKAGVYKTLEDFLFGGNKQK